MPVYKKSRTNRGITIRSNCNQNLNIKEDQVDILLGDVPLNFDRFAGFGVLKGDQMDGNNFYFTIRLFMRICYLR